MTPSDRAEARKVEAFLRELDRQCSGGSPLASERADAIKAALADSERLAGVVAILTEEISDDVQQAQSWHHWRIDQVKRAIAAGEGK